MGLQFGRNYQVKITSDGTFIWVQWDGGRFAYSSPQTLAANWKKWNG